MASSFHSVRRLPPYVFEDVNRLKARLRGQGRDIIDFGMGNPDLPTPVHITEKLIEAAQKPRTNRYSVSRGLPGLRRALAGYYERRFGVGLDPETEIVSTLGSKEGFANLAQAVAAPGDVVLAPNPSYPIHAFGFIMAGASIRHIPALDAESFLAGLHAAVRHSVPSPIAVVTCFPANPTALTVDLAFYREIVAFAKRFDLFVFSDLAYAEIFFDDAKPPPSILEVEGAKDVAVEVTSLSKTYSMAGWRVGFAAGNARLIAALARVKSYLDYGAFTPIQVAASAALNGSQDCVAETRAIYKSRRDALVEAFDRAGWSVPAPEASMFAWARLPERFSNMGSLAFSKHLIETAGVAVAPGVGFGEYGEGFVRIALVENEQRVRQAAREIRKLLSGTGEFDAAEGAA
ncbi:MAG: LL-diaminopimelate aminotransferase [Maricaulaceae bacterium]